MQIILQQVPLHISQRLGDINGLFFQFCQQALDLRVSALTLQLSDQIFAIFSSVVQGAESRVLVVVGDLQTQPAAAGVDDDVQIAFVVPVCFNKMVAAARVPRLFSALRRSTCFAHRSASRSISFT